MPYHGINGGNLDIDIRLIGVNHYDPYGRMLIGEYLKREKEKGFCPDCLAAEWDSVLFHRIRKQREYLFNKLLDERYTTNRQEAKMIADAMGFEADSHLPFFPDLPILWLDEGREYDEMCITFYADDRYKVLFKNRREKDNKFDIESTRQSLLTKPSPDYIPGDRDNNFASRVIRSIECGKKKIICIVGKSHINLQIEGSFGSLLNEYGINCSTYDTTCQ